MSTSPSGSSTRVISVIDWRKYHPWPNANGLRHLIFPGKPNGNNRLIVRRPDSVLGLSQLQRSSMRDGQPASGLRYVKQPAKSRSRTPPKLRLGHSHCRCEACGHHFNSVSVFDRHRVGDWDLRGANRRCLDPKEMRMRGWLRNSKGFWIERKWGRRRLDLAPVGGLRAEVTLSQGGSP